MLTTYESRRGLASIVDWLARPRASAQWRVPKKASDTVRPVFAGVWRDSEAEYSIILAQTLALSAKYRREFLLAASRLFDGRCGVELIAMAEHKAAFEAEKFLGQIGNIDVLLRSGDFLLAGVEHQIPSDLRKKQHLRYDEYLRLQNAHPLMVLVAPSTCQLSSGDVGELNRFVPVSYGRLVGWSDECLADWLSQTGTALEEAFQAFAPLLQPASRKPTMDMPMADRLEPVESGGSRA